MAKRLANIAEQLRWADGLLNRLDL